MFGRVFGAIAVVCFASTAVAQSPPQQDSVPENTDVAPAANPEETSTPELPPVVVQTEAKAVQKRPQKKASVVQAPEPSVQPQAQPSQLLAEPSDGPKSQSDVANEDVDPATSPNSYSANWSNTSTKFNLSARQTPQTVVVVTPQVIEDFALSDAKDVLNAAPGVYVSSERNVNNFNYMSRGYDMQVQYDGVPSSMALGLRASMTADSAALERVEIMQGASGLLTGPGFPGGTINFIRKMPTPGLQASVESSVDTWLGARVTGDVSTPLTYNGAVRARVVGTLNRDETYIDDVYSDRGMFYGVVEADLSERTTLRAGANVEHTEGPNGQAYGLPTYVDGTDLGLRRSTNLGADWGDDRRDVQTYFVGFDHKLDGGWRLKGEVNQYFADTAYLNAVPSGLIVPGGLSLVLLDGLKEAWRVDRTSIDVYANGPFELFGRKHQLMVGFNGERQEELADPTMRSTSSALDFAGYYQIFDIYNHNPSDVPVFQNFYQRDNGYDVDTLSYGGFAGVRLNPTEQLHVILGSRLTWYEAKLNGVVQDKHDNEFTPYAGVVLDVTDTTSLYASYTDIFKPNDASLRTVGGGILDPEVGTNYEVGVKSEWLGGKLNTYLALFRIEHSNIATIDFANSGLGSTCPNQTCYVASGLVTTEGIDVGASGEIAEGWKLFGGYTYIDQQYAEGEDKGERFKTYVPQHLFKLGMTYDIPGTPLTVGGNVQYRGEIYNEGLVNALIFGTYPYRVEQDSVFLVGLMAKYQLTEKAHLQFNVENLFDEKYYSGVSYPLGGQVYGDPRRAILTFRTEF